MSGVAASQIETYFARHRSDKLDSIEVLYEDEDLIAVAKPTGLVVHSRDGHSLEDLLNARFKKPAILLHRLDKDTSGVVLFAKRRPAAAKMSQAFEAGRIRKCYFAVTHGVWPQNCQKIESFISRDREGRMQSRADGPGQKSTTTFRRLLDASEISWIEALPKTGRTHQIRLHCAGIGCAILGDRRYGGRSALAIADGSSPGQALHSYRVDFQHPVSGQNLRILAPPSGEWKKTWLRGFSDADIERKLDQLLRPI